MNIEQGQKVTVWLAPDQPGNYGHTESHTNAMEVYVGVGGELLLKFRDGNTVAKVYADRRWQNYTVVKNR